MASFRFLRTTALQITDPVLRRQVLDILENPAPTFYTASPTQPDRERVCQELVSLGFIKAQDDRFPEGVCQGVFPPVLNPTNSPQRFWAAPGGAYESHHSYPGGLVIHDAFNLRTALSLAENYRLEYPGIKIDGDMVIAATLWHDAMKAVVFQWCPDESSLPELAIASTGAHHILGLAEALHRGLPPRLVVAIAAAHGSPGFEPVGKIVQWIEAAALLAHIDPVEYGVLKQPLATPGANSSVAPKLELPWPAFPEAAISNLSDGDFVLSVPAAHASIEVLREIAHSELLLQDADLRGEPFNHFRNRVFSQMTQERLYSLWLEGSMSAVMTDLRKLGLIPNK
jgi:hypothetical protein